MKKTLVIFFTIIALFITFLICIATSESNNKATIFLSELLGIRSNNKLVNPLFLDGKNHWKFTDNIDVLESNKTKFVYIKGDNREQKRFWQSINVISGETYRLSFKLKGDQYGAFAILLDLSNNNEQYFKCNYSEKEESYSFYFNSTKDYKACILFSTNKSGNYYYSNLFLNVINPNKIYLLSILSLFLLLLLYLFSVSYFPKNNILLTIIFLFFLIIPISHIDSIKISAAEKRILSNYKSVFLKKDSCYILNPDFPKNFNDWLNDHFLFRDKLLKCFNSINFIINKRINYKSASTGKNRWFFLAPNVKRISNYSEDEEAKFNETLKALEIFKSFCDNHNIKLYILVAPYLEELYSSQLIGANISKHIAAMSNTINNIKLNLDLNLLYGYDVINNAKSEGLVYYKTDHHWTELGAFKSYQLLISEISKDFPDIMPLKKEFFNIVEKEEPFGTGGTFEILNIPYLVKKEIYPFDQKYSKFFFNKTFTQNYNQSSKRCYVFGDSFVGNIRPFFKMTFKDPQFYIKPLQINMPIIESNILKYNPDILVMIIWAQNFERIKNWYKIK